MTTVSRRTLIVTASLLIAAFAAFAAWSWSSQDRQASASAHSSAGNTSTPSADTPTSGASTPTPSATVPSPTKPSISSPAPSGPSKVPAPGPARVTVVTTFAGWNATSGAVEVGGYAAVVEPVGTCTSPADPRQPGRHAQAHRHRGRDDCRLRRVLRPPEASSPRASGRPCSRTPPRGPPVQATAVTVQVP